MYTCANVDSKNAIIKKAPKELGSGVVYFKPPAIPKP
jgi:hypothetical protein